MYELIGKLSVTSRAVSVVALLAAMSSVPLTGAAQPLPSDAEIRKILAERVDTLTANSAGFGIIVGLVGPQGRRVVSYGHVSREDSRALDGDTVFEMGSVNKVLTGLLLADMVRRGEVALTDPVAKYLPQASIPSRSGRQITLVDLATHTSALPFMPEQLSISTKPGDRPATAADLYAALAASALTRDIGAAWDYSNFGYWLLGEALAARGRMDFSGLLRARVIAPLKLASTDYVLSPGMKARLAVGHDAALQPAAASSTLPVYSLMPAAGGLYSTVNDLLTLLSVSMGYEPSPLAAAVAASLETRRPMPEPGYQQALGWVVIGEGSDQLIFHDGGTLGYASCVVWDPAKRVGVVVLSNQVTSVSDIARHLVRPAFPLEHPTAARHVEIKLDSSVLDTYVGRYEATGEGVFAIVREGGFLTIQLPDTWGLPVMHIRPESRQDFFVSELPLRVTFQIDGTGRATGILVYPPRGQKPVPARRIGGSLDGYFTDKNGDMSWAHVRGIGKPLSLKLTSTRTFGNGKIFLRYEPIA